MLVGLRESSEHLFQSEDPKQSALRSGLVWEIWGGGDKSIFEFQQKCQIIRSG